MKTLRGKSSDFERKTEETSPLLGTFNPVLDDYLITEIYPPEPSWFERHILRRVSWLGVLCLAPITTLFAARKAVRELLRGGDIPQAARIATTNSLTVGGLIGLAVINLLPYGLYVGQKLARKAIIPAEFDDKKPNYLPGQQGENLIAYPNHIITLESLDTPKGRVEKVTIRPSIPGPEGPLPIPTDKYSLHLGGNGGTFQEIIPNLVNQCHINRKPYKNDSFLPDTKTHNVICLNYPGANSTGIEKYTPTSSRDLVIPGIKQVYEIIEIFRRKGWSDRKIQSNLKNVFQIHGESIGTAAALQIALHFKRTHEIDIPVFLSRPPSSISSIATIMLNRFASMPKFLARPLSKLLLHACGGWEMDSVAACKELNPEMIRGFNVAHSPEPKIRKEPKSFWDSWKELFSFSSPKPSPHPNRPPSSFSEDIAEFFFPHKHDADPVILDGATLVEGLENDSSTRAIYGKLQPIKKYVYRPTENSFNPHSDHLSRYVDEKGQTPLKLFEERLQKTFREETPDRSLSSYKKITSA